MPRGHYERTRRHSEAAVAQPNAVPEALHDVSNRPLDTASEPLAGEPEREREQTEGAQALTTLAAIRLTARYSFYDVSGDLHLWVEGEIVTEEATILLLQERGAPIVEHHGVLSGLHPDAYAKPELAPQPPEAPLRLTARYEFDENGIRRFWVPGELVSDPHVAQMLRHRGAPFADVLPDEPAAVAAIDSPLRMMAPYMFYDDAGMPHSWAIGELVTDPATAAMLRQRGAQVVAAE